MPKDSPCRRSPIWRIAGLDSGGVILAAHNIPVPNNKGGGRSVSAEENKAVSHRVAGAIGRGDFHALDELMAPDLAQEFKRDIAETRQAFPD
jgi:predicted lipid-binding transport protein (Tim44 family)